MRSRCFFFLLLIARLMWYASSCRRKFHRKGIIKLQPFPQGNVISLCGVVVRCSRVELKVPGSRPFCVVVFYKYICCGSILSLV